MKNLSIYSNKTRVILNYLGDGIVAFQVPTLSEGDTVSLCFKQYDTRKAITGLFVGRSLIFRDMLRNAFLSCGGITLNGYIGPYTGNKTDDLVFRTVIQADADIICRIDRHVLERDDCQQLLFGYELVRHQFLEAFSNRIRFLVMQIISIISISFLSLWLFFKLFTFLVD